MLIAEKNFSAIEPFIRVFADRRLDVHFDVSSSHQGAAGLLLASPYLLVISGAQLAVMDECFLLKRTQALESFVPFVVTASASQTKPACRVLEQGAFDLITRPLEHEQTERTIRLALWHNKLKTLITSQEKALNKYQEHMANYPGDRIGDERFQRALSAVETTISQVEQSILAIAKSDAGLSDFATTLEQHTRKRALERLDGLGK